VPLVEDTSFENGVVLLRYELKKQAESPAFEEWDAGDAARFGPRSASALPLPATARRLTPDARLVPVEGFETRVIGEIRCPPGVLNHHHG
jgi:hypothetical protein